VFNALGPWHLTILAVAVVVLFGSKRLPDAARSLGKSLRIFKSEVRELQGDSKPDSTATPTTVQSERVDPPAGGGQSA
jgi:sec-independent protein translocase protein TatA